VVVRTLAAILRVADGLDRGHRRHIRSLTARKWGNGVHIDVKAERGSDLEVWSARQKADLLEEIAGGPVRIRMVER
jgi:exopolyphosphatase/guanosine-5'-triphosphate,3'-diphosphate pyrophosphatase